MNKRQMSTVTRALKPFLAKGKSFRQNRKGQKIILTYHGISDRSRFNCVSVKLFRDHLAWLRDIM
jgi:hypothetical protein